MKVVNQKSQGTVIRRRTLVLVAGAAVAGVAFLLPRYVLARSRAADPFSLDAAARASVRSDGTVDFCALLATLQKQSAVRPRPSLILFPSVDDEPRSPHKPPRPPHKPPNPHKPPHPGMMD